MLLFSKKKSTSSLIDRETIISRALEQHKKWLSGKPDGICADFEFADLTGANLKGADLRSANLKGAILLQANLRGADLRDANLRGAVLRNANLIDADISNADLRDADLNDACLLGANLSNARLTNAKNIPYIPMTCPDSGAFTAWKCCESAIGWVIVKLLIPEDAKRLSSTGRKCRADKAIVQEIQTLGGKPVCAQAWSMYDPDFIYSVGETVTPDQPFCEDRWQECASGIHFFINRQEAVDY